VSIPVLGVDIGTSATKVVVGDVTQVDDASMRFAPLLRQARWPSIVSVPEVGGDAYVFRDPAPAIASARIRRNVKLLLLLPPGHPEEFVARDHTGWGPDVLYGAMAAFAMSSALSLVDDWEDFIPFVGAPLGGSGDAAVRHRFGAAVHAARMVTGARALSASHLAECVVPREVLGMIRDVIEQCTAPDREREEFVISEAHAAMLATRLSGQSLGGQNCVIDMGAGTTDIAWFAPSGWNSLEFFASRSIPMGGEGFDDELRAWVRRWADIKLDRQQLWHAKSRLGPEGDLVGDGWRMPADALQEICDFHALRISGHVVQAAGPDAASQRARFIFVGGATAFAPLRSAILRRLLAMFRDGQAVNVPEPKLFPLGDPSGAVTRDAGMWIATGLAKWLTLPESMKDAITAPEVGEGPDETSEEPASIRCTCLGTNDDCYRCGGSGVAWLRTVVARPIDGFEDRSGWVACRHCNRRVDIGVLDDHIRREHLPQVVVDDSALEPSDDQRLSEFVIRAVVSADTQPCGHPPADRLVRALHDLSLGREQVMDLLRTQRPEPGVDRDGDLPTQVMRAVRGLLWMRLGEMELAVAEARAIRLAPVREYLGRRGVQL
jgi:hypothetical protein